jgi:mannose-6-phosphate isomerase
MSVPAPLEPLLFQRIAKTAVWGGRAMAERLAVEVDPDMPVGETWELSDYPNATTAVRGGSCDGVELQQLLAEHADLLLGESRLDQKGRFPLLVKIIEARKDLSVQVHPPDNALEPGGIGKTEAWYILPESSVEASIIAGLQTGTDPEALARDASQASVLNHLVESRVQGGDCVLIEAGTPHAIRAGTLLVEVQQTSDLTLRMYDWGRVGLDGRPRETHLEQALQVIDYDASAPKIVRATYPSSDLAPVARLSALVECEYFRLHEIRLTGDADHNPDGFARVLVVLDGSGTINGPQSEPRRIGFGDTILLPARMGTATLCPDASGLHLLEAVAL